MNTGTANMGGSKGFMLLQNGVEKDQSFPDLICLLCALYTAFLSLIPQNVGKK